MHLRRSLGSWAEDGCRSQVPRPVRVALLVVGLLAIEFQLWRLLLCWSNRDLASGAPAGALARAFWVGWRFDLAMAAYLALPLVLLMAVVIRWARPAVQRRVLLVALVAVSVVVALLAIVEREFYREFFTRFNSLAVHYWAQPRTVLSMVWYGYPVVRPLLILAIGGTLLARGLRPLVGWALSDERPGEPRWPVQGMWSAGLMLALVVSARGGLRTTPLKWGDAMHSAWPFANQLALNGAWTLGNAILHRERHDQLESLWSSQLPLDEAQAHTRALVGLDHERFVGDGRSYPLLRTSRGGSRRAALQSPQPGQDPPHVVVIVMESFSARFVGAVGSDDDTTPEFNRLARQGILFDRCFSAGTHTHQANVAVFAGFPNLPGYESLMENYREGNQPFESLPRALKRRGYQTSFFYNGDLSWENMRGFFRVQDVEQFVERDDFDQSARFDHTWGVSDHDLFCRLDAELAQAQRPMFAAVLTLSNHAPFELPRPLPFPEITDQGVMNDRLNGIRYADWALGQFFAKARQQPYFANTLFVLVGDHGFSVAPLLTELGLLRFHVPLLFYAPGLLEPAQQPVHTVASQLDIAPTVLGLLGDRGPRQHWGRDLFALADEDPGWAIFKPSSTGGDVAMARGEWLLVRTETGQSRLYRYDLGFPASVESVAPQRVEGRRLESDLRAYLVTATEVLRSGHATVASETAVAERRVAQSR